MGTVKLGGRRDSTSVRRKGIPVWGMWYPFRVETERYRRIHPPNNTADEVRAAAREHGVEVRVGDRRRPARVSDVTNPNTRHILPMILGKWLIAGTEKRAATDVKRKIIFFSCPSAKSEKRRVGGSMKRSATVVIAIALPQDRHLNQMPDRTAHQATKQDLQVYSHGEIECEWQKR